jgi:hypothetical protein
VGERFIHISDREEREERMDDLERQMEHLRSQMQRTLSGAEGSGRLTVLDRLRSVSSGRAAPRDAGGSSKDARDSAEGPPTPTDAGGGSQEATEAPRRGFWSRLFGS